MKNYYVEEMTLNAAEHIAKWKYPAPYEMYSFSDNDAEIEELLNGLHFAVYTQVGGNERIPCGFAAIGWSAQVQDKKLNDIYEDESYTDIAFGLKPELCGQGLGEEFVKDVIDFVKEMFEEDGVRLTVDTKNERACKLYEKLGFKEIHAFNTKCVDVARGKTLSMKIMVL